MPTVGSHAISPFPSPVRGPAVDANLVRGNDNRIQEAFVAHDADATIHVQSSTLAERPAAGEVGRVWVTEDSGVYQAWYDDGNAWQAVGVSGGAISLDDLTDVTITSPSSGQLLQYNGTQWVNAPIGINNLVDVTVSGPSSGQVLEYNGSIWVNATPATTTYALNDLTDVVISAPSSGQALRFNGAFWGNANVVNNLNDLGDVSVISPSAGQLLRYNGGTWVNVTNVDLPGTLDVTGNATFDSTLTLNTVTYTFPPSDGVNNSVLTTNGSGSLEWETVAQIRLADAWAYSNFV